MCKHLKCFVLVLVFFIIACTSQYRQKTVDIKFQKSNILNYAANPQSAQYRNSLAFSDQGAWFAYGFPTEPRHYGGFAGPFLMTQENGVWCSPVLSQLRIEHNDTGQKFDWSACAIFQTSYNSHLEQVYQNEWLQISQKVFFASAHTAIIVSEFKNVSDKPIRLKPHWTGKIFLNSLRLSMIENGVKLQSDKSSANGYIQVLDGSPAQVIVEENNYTIVLADLELKPGENRELVLAHSFVFPEYETAGWQENFNSSLKNPYQLLNSRILEKEQQLTNLFNKLPAVRRDSLHKMLVAKSVLTLQNNWRVPAGELKHSGLFPSYHYIWFHGFWAWDSWKHAVALAQYDTELAKEQVKAMYDFMEINGFIADCVYRDTTIERHNFRNTKPPLSAWAVWNIYKQDKDLDFLREIYPKIITQHNWWYQNRDHDRDGLCEYGCTDGTLIAAKWESGMDNAVRFDDSQILKNSESAHSLTQESVDLNAYLFAEKNFLAELALTIGKQQAAALFIKQADTLRNKIQNQFYDAETDWFYDTSIDGESFIRAMGCEGWIPLWAQAATEEQAEAVMQNIMREDYFNTKVPLQTLSASHPKFNPDRGYWRGPTWLDQAYFGVKGLKNYGYKNEADLLTHKLIYNAEGVTKPGKSIRENYNPVTGAGLESENFSWSAAHYLLLILSE